MIKTNRVCHNMAAVAVVFAMLTGLFAWVLSGASVMASNSGEVNFLVDVPSACSLVVVGGTNNTKSVDGTINPGADDDIGSATIQSLCNDSGGLAVYAVGYTGNTYGETKLISTTNSENYIQTGIASEPTSSQWYMSLAAVSGNFAPTIASGFTTDHVIPNVYTKVAYRNLTTDTGSEATGAQFTVTFGAYISTRQISGTYSGRVKFLLVHPNVLTYDSQTGNPATYAPNTLARDPEAPYILQEVNDWSSEITLGQTIEAIDMRDGQTYTVSRYNMGNNTTALWMSNLNIGAEELDVEQLDGTNTHLPTNGSGNVSAATFATWIKSSGSMSYTNPELIPVSGEDAYGNKYATLYNFAAASAGTYVYPGGSGPSTADYDLCPAGWRLPTGGLTTDFNNSEYDNFIISNGGLSTGMGDNTNPTGTEFSTILQRDFGFPLAGYFYGSISDKDSAGEYWSSRIGDGQYDFSIFKFYSNSVLYRELDAQRNTGRSVRCIAS